MNTQYKETPIGKIPKDWDVIDLEKACFKITDGSHFSPKEDKNGVFRIATVANIDVNRIDIKSCKKISKSDYEKLVKNGCQPDFGDVLFSKDGTVGLCFSYKQNENIVLLSSIAIIKTKEILNPDFCAYILKSPIVFQRIVGSKRGTGLRRIILEDLKRVKIPVPKNILEQKKIVDILSTVDDAIQKADESIVKTELLKKGLMQELLTKGIGHKEFRDTKIGSIPNSWMASNLGDESIAKLIMGQSPPSSTYNKKEIGLPFLQGKNEFGEIFPLPVIYCEKPIKIAEKNDILLSVRAPVGDVNIASSKCCIGRGLAAIRANRDKLHPMFLFYYLKFSNRIFESLSMGSTFKAIRKSEIENFSIPLPPLPEQQKIVEILSNIDKKLELQKQRKIKLERIKKGLMNDLLTGRKRVKVAR